MIKLVLLGICIAVIILLTSKRPALVRSRFHGYWNVSLMGNEFHSTFQILISDEGKIEGTAFLEEEKSFALSGKVDATGELSIAGNLQDQTLLITGNMNDMEGKGSWHFLNESPTGVWNASKV